MGQQAMKVLFKEPIKEAVRESLAEEGLIEGKRLKQSGETSTDSSSAASENERSTIRNVILPAAAALGVAFAARQLSGSELQPEQVTEKIRGGDTPMEEDMSKSDSAESGRSQFAEEDSEEVSV